MPINCNTHLRQPSVVVSVPLLRKVTSKTHSFPHFSKLARHLEQG